MARIAYPALGEASLAPLVGQIVAERGQVLHLYQMLLNSPPVAAGWLNLLTAIRQKNSLPGDVRELVIMRVAALNGAPYEAEQHRPIAVREGLSEETVDALGDWRSSALFDERLRAVLAYADAMTEAVQVPTPVFDDLKTHFDNRQIVDLTVTVAAYNMVSRFLEALQIHSGDERPDPPAAASPKVQGPDDADAARV